MTGFALRLVLEQRLKRTHILIRHESVLEYHMCLVLAIKKETKFG